MALTQRLQLRQSQALVMTPQLMQAIKLLQPSHHDLVAYVEAELKRNPLLDRGAETEGTAGERNPEQTSTQPTANGEVLKGSGEFEGVPATREEKAQDRIDDPSGH